MHLVARSYNSLPEKRRKDAVNKSWRVTNELVDMLNKDYIPCLRSLLKGDVKSAVSTYFDHKQCFNKFNLE